MAPHDTPYQQTAGEKLAFTIQELSGGGANGFNHYGSADANRYANGQMFFTYTAGQPLAASPHDFTFKTLVVVPEPSMGLLTALGAGGTCMYRRRRI